MVLESQQVLTLAGQLGIAAPLIGILIMLLRGADSERRELTGKFLVTLETTIKSNAEGAVATATALAEIVRTANERSLAASTEHGRMVELLQDIARDLRTPVPKVRP